MAYGIETYRQDASVMMNGLTVGGVLIDVLRCPAGTNGNKDYPNTQANNLRIVTVSTTGAHSISTSTIVGASLGARITWNYLVAPPQSDTVMYVFNTQPTAGELYGIHVLNDVGEVLADQGYPSPQFAGKAAPTTQASQSYQTPDGYSAHVHSYGLLNKRPGADQLIVMAMPDVGTKDTWYHMRRNHILAEEGNVLIEVVVYTKATAYDLPTLHFFAVNKPVASGDLYGMRLYTASGVLTFDASAENMGNVKDLRPSAGDYGVTSTLTLPLTSLPGLMIPYRKVFKFVNTLTQTLVSVAKKVGSQFTTTMLLDKQVTKVTSDREYAEGVGTGYTPVVNLSAQAPLVYPGTPASQKPYFTQNPVSTFGRSGQTRSFSCLASGVPSPTYRWYRNGSPISGATSSTYTFTVTSSYDVDTFFCVASNSAGSATSDTATFYLEEDFEPPYLISESGEGSYSGGQTVTIRVVAGGNPTPKVRIGPVNGQYVEGTGSATMTFVASYSPGVQDIQYTIFGQGQYLGVTIQDFVQIFVNPPPTPKPVFTSLPSNISVTTGASAVFSATANNTTSYAWYRDGSYVGNGASHSATTTNTGTFQYEVVATGPGGSTSAFATLTVTAPVTTPKPVFSNQPNSRTVTQGGSTSFSVTASNTTSYEWYRDGYFVGGGSSHAPDTSSVGVFTYYCIASGAGGSTQSSSATLTVNAPPLATYPSYNNLSGTVTGTDEDTMFAVFRGGYSSLNNWANGSGDGTLYRVRATGTWTPAVGSFNLGEWYDFSDYDGVGYIAPLPSSNKGITRTLNYTLNVTVALKSTGAVVSSGSITISVTNSGTNQ